MKQLEMIVVLLLAPRRQKVRKSHLGFGGMFPAEN